MDDLTKLPNIGPVLASRLAEVGIETYKDLASLGSVEVVLRLSHTDPSACYKMLYAIEGAIRGVRWHAIPKDERARVRAQFDLARLK